MHLAAGDEQVDGAVVLALVVRRHPGLEEGGESEGGQPVVRLDGAIPVGEQAADDTWHVHQIGADRVGGRVRRRREERVAIELEKPLHKVTGKAR